MSPSRSGADVYTDEQIDAYLSHIAFPKAKYVHIAPADASTEAGFGYLSSLQKHQLATVPFENLSLHCSKERIVSLDREDLFDKFVTSKNGRGGYCMENNLFFGTVLKTLGFDVVHTGARVFNLTGSVDGWNHHVNLVTIAGTTYLVDVGFSGNGPTRPMPLSQGQISKWGATKAETRLTYEENANQIVQGLWTLEHRISESQDWVPIYHFGMTEFLPQDFETMNFATSNRKTSFFTYKILCLNLIYDEDVDDITGALILNGGELKRRIYENSEILIDCKTEKERVGVLKEHFGIILSEREKAAIRSTVTELTG